MRVVAITGAVDKRPLVYLAARALAVGRFVAIVSDDGVYRRFLNDGQMVGTSGRVNVVTSLKPTDKVLGNLKEFGTEPDIVLVVTDSTLPETVDYVLHCEPRDTSFKHGGDVWQEKVDSLKSGEYLEAGSKKPNSYVVVSFDPAPKTCDVPWLQVTWDMLVYCMACEENRGLLPYTAKDKKIMSQVCEIMSEALDIPKSELETLVTREDYINKAD